MSGIPRYYPFTCDKARTSANILPGLHLQAATKLLLAEGSKVVMVASQNSYSQGIYGLVSNLGSLVVRTIFQVSHGLAG